MDWIDVAQERDRSRDVNLVFYLRVPLNAGNFWTRQDLLTSQDGFCFMHLLTKSGYSR
jgi:hypothetical protein